MPLFGAMLKEESLAVFIQGLYVEFANYLDQQRIRRGFLEHLSESPAIYGVKGFAHIDTEGEAPLQLNPL